MERGWNEKEINFYLNFGQPDLKILNIHKKSIKRNAAPYCLLSIPKKNFYKKLFEEEEEIRNKQLR